MWIVFAVKLMCRAVTLLPNNFMVFKYIAIQIVTVHITTFYKL